MSKTLEHYVKITPEAQKVTEAECFMTTFLVEHNLPISIAVVILQVSVNENINLVLCVWVCVIFLYCRPINK